MADERARTWPTGPLAGVPLAVKDLFCTEGVPSAAGSRILEGYRPPYTATAVRNLAEAGARCSARPTWTSSRWARRTRTPASARSRTRGTPTRCRAARPAAPPPRWPPAWRRGRSAPTPAARSASPRRCAAIVGLKPTYGAVSRYGMIAFASSLDQAGPLTRDVTDAALLFRHMVGSDPCDSTSTGLPEEIGLPTAERLDGMRFGVPAGAHRRAASSRACRRCSRPSLKLIEELGGDADGGRPAARRARHLRLLRDRARGGQRQPGPLRRRALRPPRRQRRPAVAVRGDARGGLRRRGQAPDHARHLRALLRLLRRLLRQRPEGAHQDRRGLPRRLRAGRPDRHARPRPTVAFGLGERTDDPLAMYLSDFCTVPMSLAGIPAISIPGGLSEGLPVGIQLAGPAFSENRILDAAHALEQAIGFDGSGGAVPELGAGHRAGDPRPAADQDEDVLRLRAVLRRGAQHAHLPGLPGPSRHAAGDQRRGGALRADDRHGAGLRDRPAVDLPPQELLLSRPAEGLPDLPVRHPACGARAAGRHPHPPRAPRGGRRQARARRRVGPDPLRRGQRGRLQPRRHAAGGDRDRARRALAPSRPRSGCACCG